MMMMMTTTTCDYWWSVQIFRLPSLLRLRFRRYRTVLGLLAGRKKNPRQLSLCCSFARHLGSGKWWSTHANSSWIAHHNQHSLQCHDVQQSRSCPLCRLRYFLPKNGPVFRKQIEGTQFKERWSKNVMIFIYRSSQGMVALTDMCDDILFVRFGSIAIHPAKKRGETDSAGSSVKSGRWTCSCGKHEVSLLFWTFGLWSIFWEFLLRHLLKQMWLLHLSPWKKTPFFFSSYLVLGFFPLGAYVVGVRKRCVRKMLGYLVIHKKQAGIPMRNTFELVYWILLAILAKACKNYNI